MAANGRQGAVGRRLHIQLCSQYVGLPLCQIWCFYQKVHNRLAYPLHYVSVKELKQKRLSMVVQCPVFQYHSAYNSFERLNCRTEEIGPRPTCLFFRIAVDDNMTAVLIDN